MLRGRAHSAWFFLREPVILVLRAATATSSTLVALAIVSDATIARLFEVAFLPVFVALLVCLLFDACRRINIKLRLHRRNDERKLRVGSERLFERFIRSEANKR